MPWSRCLVPGISPVCGHATDRCRRKEDQATFASSEDLFQSSNPFGAGSVIGLRHSPSPSCPLQFVLPLNHPAHPGEVERLDAIHLVREQRENRNQDLAFHARPFILCGIPLRQPPSSQLVHTRHNGKFSLQIVGHPQFGLPYGQDRLVPIWVATLAVRQKSRVVHFSSAAEMLSFFRLSLDGRHYRRLVRSLPESLCRNDFLRKWRPPGAITDFDWDRFAFFRPDSPLV